MKNEQRKKKKEQGGKSGKSGEQEANFWKDQGAESY